MRVNIHNMDVTPGGAGALRLEETAYLADVRDQPRALRALLAEPAGVLGPASSSGLPSAGRVVLSGIGSSHFASHRLWRALVARGTPAWWIDSAELLDVRHALLTPGTVLWLTSQSGESAETVRLLDALPAGVHVVGVTNVPTSTLGEAADSLILLRSGAEATVSTKSYLNSLVVGRLVAAMLDGAADAALESLAMTASAVESYLQGLDAYVGMVGDFAQGRNLLVTGRGEAVPSAQAAALVLKESSKTSVEGMSGSVLRHGVIELAGPTLAVMFLDHSSPPYLDQNLRLVADLRSRGTDVAWLGPGGGEGVRVLPAPAASRCDPLIRDALGFQTLSFALAKRNGVTPGAFEVASKITDVL